MQASELESIIQEIGFVPDGLSEANIERILKDESINAIFYKSLCGFWVEALQAIHQNAVPGDIIQCGVWKGGTACFIKHIANRLQLHKEMWLADFYGKNVSITIAPEHTKDRTALLAAAKYGIVPPDKAFVENNFKKFRVWDNHLHFLEGDVAHTLTSANISNISLLHADVDFYEPTWNVLQLLYAKVAVGGYVVIDDYGVETLNCKDAVDKFRTQNNITEPLHFLGPYSAYWVKQK